MNQDGSRKPAALIRERNAIDADVVAILSNHRIVAPFGVAGGAPGATGHNWVQRGDVFVIETPGGGYGDADAD